MILINAVINNSLELGIEQNRLLDESMAQMGIEKYIIVSLLPHLPEELEANKDKEILLFSNFPPMISYMHNGILNAALNQQVNPVPNWEVPKYAFTAGLFYQLCKQYPMKAIHFITGARKEIVSDKQILSLTGDIPATILRTQDWKGPEKDHEILLRLYLVKKIRETLGIEDSHSAD
jgi:hypothetical protein